MTCSPKLFLKLLFRLGRFKKGIVQLKQKKNNGKYWPRKPTVRADKKTTNTRIHQQKKKVFCTLPKGISSPSPLHNPFQVVSLCYTEY